MGRIRQHLEHEIERNALVKHILNYHDLACAVNGCFDGSRVREIPIRHIGQAPMPLTDAACRAGPRQAPMQLLG